MSPNAQYAPTSEMHIFLSLFLLNYYIFSIKTLGIKSSNTFGHGKDIAFFVLIFLINFQVLWLLS